MRDGVQYDTQIDDFMAQTEKIRRNSQNLQKNMTKEERHLWYDFLKNYPVPFHRQYSFENYIVDFYCHKAKLVIELHGSQHCDPKRMEYDRIRTDYLQSLGLHVLRISNLDTIQQFENVCHFIDRMVKARVPAP